MTSSTLISSECSTVSGKRPAKPKTDSFPAHLRREEQIAPLLDEDQKQADSGASIERILVNKVLHCKKP